MSDQFTVWMDAADAQLLITCPAGPLMAHPVSHLPLLATIANGELLRFVYDRVDPETGDVTRGAARIMVEELPDPRKTMGEEQPATPAEATPTVFDAARQYTGSGYLEGFRRVANATADVNPAADPITPAEHAEGARYVDRPSGPPFRVDGDGAVPGAHTPDTAPG